MSFSPTLVEHNAQSRVNRLKAQLKELENENEFLGKSILKLNKTLKSLEDSLSTSSRPNFQVLKSRIENESKHTRLHLAISENLKKAMKELRTNESIKCAKISRENFNICNYSTQSDALKFNEGDLLASLERLKLNLRTSVNYKSLRPSLCSSCSLTIKRVFREKLLESFSKKDSIRRSLMEASPDYQNESSKESCKCSLC